MVGFTDHIRGLFGCVWGSDCLDVPKKKVYCQSQYSHHNDCHNSSSNHSSDETEKSNLSGSAWKHRGEYRNDYSKKSGQYYKYSSATSKHPCFNISAGGSFCINNSLIKNSSVTESNSRSTWGSDPDHRTKRPDLSRWKL